MPGSRCSRASSATRCRSVNKNGSAGTSRASIRSRAIAAERRRKSVPVTDLDDLDPNREGLPGGLVLAEPHRCSDTVQHRNPGHLGQRLLEELELFRSNLSGELLGQPGNVGTGLGQTGDEPCLYRIGGIHHDNRNRLRRSLSRQRRRLGGGDEHVHVLPHKVGGHLGESLTIPGGPAILEADVPALDVTQLSQAIRKCHDDVGGRRRGRGHEQPDIARLRWRLGVCRPRAQSRGGRYPADERSPVHHSMT
jgi:hypothetical protein